MWDEHFGGWENFGDRQGVIAAYEAHVDDVRNNCFEQRLIEGQVSDGWAPLCDALGVAAPDVPVPHLSARTSP